MECKHLNLIRGGWSRIASIILVAVASFVAAPQLRADSIWDQMAALPDVESTYVSGRFAHNYRQWNMMNRALNLEMGFSSLYAFSFTSASSVKKANELLNRYLRENKNVELVLKTTQNGSDYRMYEKFGADNKLYQWIIWDSMASEVCELVIINWKDGYTKK